MLCDGYFPIIGISCSSCRADIRGPYRNLTAVMTPNFDVFEADESMPSVFYCTFTCHDHTLGYNFRLYIDIIYDPSLSSRDSGGDFISLDTEDLYKEDHFNITTTTISSCSHTNKSTYEIRIDLSIDQETPTLIPKCAVQHDNNLCFSYDTFIITPSTTTATTPTRSIETMHPKAATSPHTSNRTQSCISYIGAFGSGIGILGVLLVTETAAIIFLVHCMPNQEE